MSIKALLPAAPSVDLRFLDDTGSGSFNIFENPDLQALQIPPWPMDSSNHCGGYS